MTTVVMKAYIFWVIRPESGEINRHFGESYSLNLHCLKVSQVTSMKQKFKFKCGRIMSYIIEISQTSFEVQTCRRTYKTSAVKLLYAPP
jgi:hypothetical protein